MSESDYKKKKVTGGEDGYDPYLTPTVNTLMNPEKLGTKDLRQRFVREEMAVLAVGWFFYFVGSVLIGSAAIAFWVFFYELLEISQRWHLLGFVLFIAGSLYLITGFGLRRFDSWSRMPAMIASITSIAFLPIGFLASPVCFVLLKNNAVKEIFTPEYQTAVVAEGEMIKHYGWLAVLGGLLTSVSLFLILYWQSKGYF